MYQLHMYYMYKLYMYYMNHTCIDYTNIIYVWSKHVLYFVPATHVLHMYGLYMYHTCTYKLIHYVEHVLQVASLHM